MSMENRFNLVDEPWIPIVDVGLVSLGQIFSHPEYRALGGNPVQKIAITKLLLAIAQAAYTPDDDQDWASLKSDGLADKCNTYLDQWHDRFFLYGEKPFLQVPAIRSAAIQSFGAVQAEISSGNTTVLTQTQVEKPLTDADKALLIVQLMGFGLGGKKTDNAVVLSPGYHGKQNDKGKPATGKPSASIGFLGFLHNFLQGQSLQQTLWLNLFTAGSLAAIGMYPQGTGTAPWERMPIGEACPAAMALQSSLMGRLLPLSRFCFLTDDGLHYSEGIAHPGYKDGVVDPSVSVNYYGKDPKAIWVDPDKRPWRVLTALLSFFEQSADAKFNCHQLRFGIGRTLSTVDSIGIWSGGLRVSSNAGEQYVSGTDDFVESLIQLNCSSLDGLWFANLRLEMDVLDQISKSVYGATLGYFKAQKMEADKQAALASTLFWQLCERRFQDLVFTCDDASRAQAMRVVFTHFANKAYDNYCPANTARQLDAWASNRPKLSKFLNHRTKETV